ncbi:gp436 family protein [Phocoenobacter skyensis]|uniref:DUF1320 domain-containing protein n=1 Tax=Phocoenobacter skyensis TaxID=97481 RepID=A0ABT9JKQ5_9PAST|nr:DUF1320 domain-containing protein [Pasteurella skyensis]MDP8079519.1 DUF1320 domain-containing protein [Pasteurella skyensis]MDP8085391.1 DUF1320 domain-containing protein [Pasteurella skyensis]
MYCNKQDLITAFGQLEIERLAEQDSEIEKAIADAEAEINLYLANRYILPISDVPPALNRIACDVAHYYLYITVDKESTVYLRYQQRIKQLNDIATGKISLLLSEKDGQVNRPDEQQVVFIKTNKKVFGR